MVSAFFILIYEAIFAKSKRTKSFSPIQKLADMIFFEREFADWLRVKFGEKFTKETYSKYFVLKYFKNFIIHFNKIKKEIILEQLLLNEKLPDITKYEYDVDIVETYFKTKAFLETQITLEHPKTNTEYLNGFLHPIEYYCKINQMPIDRVMQSKYPIIIQNNAHNFQAFLGRTLITFDVNKIEAILSYQNSLWKGEGGFASLVEHLVYSFVLRNSPFDNNERLSKIMDWVGKNRTFVFPEATKEERGKGATTKFGETTGEIVTYEYWPYTEDKLQTLYKLLVDDNKIEKIDSFSELFKTYNAFPTNPIIWRTATIQLMYLLHLLFKKEPQFKSQSIHLIAFKLFKSTDKQFTPNGLNTTLIQAKKYDDPGVKLSPGLKSIKSIYDSLGLN